MPKANSDYWRAKIAGNRARDEKTVAALSAIGWRALVIYECELKDSPRLKSRLDEALGRDVAPQAPWTMRGGIREP